MTVTSTSLLRGFESDGQIYVYRGELLTVSIGKLSVTILPHENYAMLTVFGGGEEVVIHRVRRAPIEDVKLVEKVKPQHHPRLQKKRRFNR